MALSPAIDCARSPATCNNVKLIADTVTSTSTASSNRLTIKTSMGVVNQGVLETAHQLSLPLPDCNRAGPRVGYAPRNALHARKRTRRCRISISDFSPMTLAHRRIPE